MLKIVHGCGDLRLTRDWQAANCNTRVKRVEKMNSHSSWSTTGQKVQTGYSVTSRLELVAQSSREAKPPANFVLKKKTDSSHFTLTLVYIPLIPTKCRELPERILREKPQRKTRLTHPQSLHRNSSNSSTLFLSIVTSLRGTLPKSFLTIPISVRRPFGALGSS